MTLTGHFIPTERGNLFVTQFGDVTSDVAVLCLPPIFEELNLSRAVIAKQAQCFAAKNLPCFVMDYFATGDSEGELEQANSDIWINNVINTGQWLEQQGIKKIILWGVRFGGLLALANQKKLLSKLPIVHQLLWKPITNGKPFMSQFLRIKQANDIMRNINGKINWRDAILSGQTVEIAGYPINAALFSDIEALMLAGDFQALTKVTWCELASIRPSPAIDKILATDEENNITIHCLPSLLFWQTAEIFDAPELIASTFAALNAELEYL